MSHWAAFGLGWALCAIGCYFIRKGDWRDLQRTRAAFDALLQLRNMSAEIAESDAHRWKCVALGVEWEYPRVTLSPEREIELLRARINAAHLRSAAEEEHD